MSSPTNWRTLVLPEVAEIVCGGTPSTKISEYWGPEIDWVTAKDVSECDLVKIWKTERQISRKGLENSSAKMLPALATVLIARGATMGKCRLVARPMALNQTCYGIVAKEDTDPRFLFYTLHSLYDHFRTVAHGTVFDTVIGSGLRSLRLRVPGNGEQRAIGEILGTLDDKIELNRQMNETLEAMARATFKSWFMDFDPVRAKTEGRQPVGMDAETASLFPDSFQDSSLGKIPEGWQVGTVGEAFRIIMGQSPPGDTYNEVGDGLPFFQGRKDFGFRYPMRRVFCTASTRIANPGDTLVSVRAPVGEINMAAEKCCVGRGVAAVRHKSGSRSYTYYAMQSLATDFARFEAEGTVFGSINKKGFHELLWIIPPSELVGAFENVAYPLDQQIEVKVVESTTLAAIRDALLPKFISGELRVKDAYKSLEAST